jgi:hypothetical protein
MEEKDGNKEAIFRVLSGEIQLDHFQVENQEEVVFDNTMTLSANEPLILSFSGN